MRALKLLFAAGLLFAAPVVVHADPPTYAQTVSACGTPNNTPVVGNPYPITMDTTGKLCFGGTTTATIAGTTSNATSGVATSSTNLPTVSYNYGFNGTTWDQLQVDGSKNLKVLGSAVASGFADGWDVTEGTKSDAATCATTNTLIACTRQLHADLIAALPVGSNIIGKVGIDQTTAVTTNGVIIAPSSAAAAGIAPVVTGSALACQVLKASAGNLYSTSGYVSAAAWIMVFNATSAPGDGTVTPAAVIYAANAGSWSALYDPVPLYLGTGITVCASSTGPYTKTAFSTSNFITGQVN